MPPAYDYPSQACANNQVGQGISHQVQQAVPLPCYQGRPLLVIRESQSGGASTTAAAHQDVLMSNTNTGPPTTTMVGASQTPETIDCPALSRLVMMTPNPFSFASPDAEPIAVNPPVHAQQTFFDVDELHFSSDVW
jgi:hypothetical protein